MSNAYKAKLQVTKKPKQGGLVLNHNRRNIVAKRTERRRGIFSQDRKDDKPKKNQGKKIGKNDIKDILSQGAQKNKEEMEQLLYSHGGNFKTDFGLRDTMDFESDSRAQGWNRLFEYIQGNIQDGRIDQTIETRVNPKGKPAQKAVPKKILSPIKSPSHRPDSLTEITKIFQNNITSNKKSKNTKQTKKKKKFKRTQLEFRTPPPKDPNRTIDPHAVFKNEHGSPFQNEYNPMNDPSFYETYNQYPENPSNNKLRNLKMSVSKMSTDFEADRLFLKRLKENNGIRNQPGFMSANG